MKFTRSIVIKINLTSYFSMSLTMIRKINHRI